jgi:hypothetical protein
VGKYTIDTLLEVLNSKIPNIQFTLTIEQTIKVQSLDETEFNLLDCMLLRDNLGFTSKIEGKTNYISDNIWDLRINTKIYLYLTNLSETVPFGILFTHGLSFCEFKFKEPFDLDRLDIVFKDAKGNLYNFYNLDHSLVFMLNIIKS